MNKNKRLFNTKDVAIIAMQVAALIVGGYFIVLTVGQFPLPGIKYVAMAPYLTLIMVIVAGTSKKPYRIFYVNLVFAAIMSTVNLYMGLAIFLVGGICGLEERFLNHVSFKNEILGISYAVWTVGISLLVSKYLIGSALFQLITPIYMLLMMLCAVFTGGIGAYFARIILKRLLRH